MASDLPTAEELRKSLEWWKQYDIAKTESMEPRLIRAIVLLSRQYVSTDNKDHNGAVHREAKRWATVRLPGESES